MYQSDLEYIVYVVVIKIDVFDFLHSCCVTAVWKTRQLSCMCANVLQFLKAAITFLLK